jgi:riboflavin kinase / FMN adenylyltransferase
VELIRHIASHPRRFRAPVVTLGNFDGVHRGHQAILKRVIDDARAANDVAIVVTFEPHPVAVLRPEHAPSVLTSLRDRLRLLAASGIDVVVLQRFTRAFAEISAEEFVERFLAGRLQAGKVVVGHSVSFGHARRGNAALLERLATERGFALEVVGPVRVDGHVVSSSTVRQAVAAGDVRLAAALLGRPHRLGGRVVPGRRRGVAIGFPTANVHVRAGMCPADGVYAVVVETAGSRHLGVANVGRNPTFGEGAPRTLEVHIFDFEGDLYGRRCDVELVERLRGEITFPSVDALIAQIRRDAEQARAVLAQLG